MEINLYNINYFLTHSYFFMPCSVQCHINNIVIFQHHPFDRKSDGCSKDQKVKLFWSMSKGREDLQHSKPQH